MKLWKRSSERSSRRAFLSSAAAGAAGLVVGRTPAAQAATGDPLILGQTNSSQDPTTLDLAGDVLATAMSITSTGLGLSIKSRGTAVEARGAQGLFGVGKTVGVGGTAAPGGFGVVGGVFKGTGVSGSGVFGVKGFGSARGITGVFGRGLGQSDGVQGESRGSVGVRARGLSTRAVALRAEGRVQFISSGLAVIPKGETSVTVTLRSTTGEVKPSPESLVLATVQSDGGTLRKATKNVEEGTITLALTARAKQDVSIAWFLIG